MKYIENAQLLELTNFMSKKEVGACLIDGKVEGFNLVKSHIGKLCVKTIQPIKITKFDTAAYSSSSTKEISIRNHFKRENEFHQEQSNKIAKLGRDLNKISTSRRFTTVKIIFR